MTQKLKKHIFFARLLHIEDVDRYQKGVLSGENISFAYVESLHPISFVNKHLILGLVM